MSFITCSRPSPLASRPRVRLTWTTSKPPEPSPRSSAATLTTTSSPSRISPSSAVVGPGRAPLAVDLDRQRILADDDAAAQLQPAAHPGAARLGAAPRRRSPRRPRASRRGRAAETHSFAVWTSFGAVGEQDAVEAVEAQRVGVAAAADRGADRLVAGAAQARPRPAPGRARTAASGSRGRALRSGRRRRSRARWRPRRRRRSSRRRRRRRARRRGCAPRRWMPQCPGTTLPEVPPVDQADVGGRLRRRAGPAPCGAIAAAAAAIALLPSSGSIPA